ncbi:MAG: cohesin domain-containing protein [Roseburia sp.]
MKHVKKILCGLLFSFTLLAGSMPAMADENVIQTTAVADGKTVTVAVTAEKGTELTSGRVVVSYDKDMLTLKTVETANTWEAEDVNTEAEEGVSYAFADSEGNNKGGDVITLTFLANDAANGKETTVKTEVKELYNKDDSLNQAGSVEEVKVTPAWEENNNETSGEDKPNEDKPDENKVDESKPGTVTTESQNLAEVLSGQITNAADGAKISVSVSASEEVISSNVFESLMGKNVTVEFKLENGVVWKINGKNIKNPKDIDLGVAMNSTNIPEAAFEMITDDGIQYEVQFSLDFDGDLGGTFELSIPVGTKGTGFFGNLYYYNPSTNALEYMQTGSIDENGMVTFSFTHASDYVVAVSETDGATVNTVKTGDQTSYAGYFLLLCGAAVVLVAAGKRIRKKACNL